MSSLLRYKKAGGFSQLLSLVETFGPQKKEKFLEIIEAESPVWAKAIREKMITFERLFSWPEQVVVEVFRQLQPKTMAFALQGLKEDQRAKILAYFSHAEKRRMDDILLESQPKPDEIAATLVKVVEQTRKMLKNRELHAEKFDEALIIPEDFEVKLEEMAAAEQFKHLAGEGDDVIPANTAQPEATAAQPAAQAAAQEATSADIIQLQKKVAQILKENKQLKDEVALLRGKLEQIKKIA